MGVGDIAAYFFASWSVFFVPYDSHLGLETHWTDIVFFFFFFLSGASFFIPSLNHMNADTDPASYEENYEAIEK